MALCFLSPPPEACGACRFYGGDPSVEWGACRRHAPVATPEHDGLLRGWPIVYPDDHCGDFLRDATERGHGPATKVDLRPDGPPPGFPDLAARAGWALDPAGKLIFTDPAG